MDMLNVLNFLTQRSEKYLSIFFRPLIFFLCLIAHLSTNAQDFCSTPQVSDNVIYESVLQSANNNGPFYLKIYVHVIRNNNGNGGQSVQDVEDALAYLDEDFNPHNVFFVWDCEINYINDSYWYDGPVNNRTGIFSVNNHIDGIDIYLFPANAGAPGGRANGVGGSSEFWVSGTWSVGNFPVAQSHITSHEMGHVLNLWHTHHGCESGKWENTDGSNCLDAGDYVCDTPADPHLSWKVNLTTCEWLQQTVCFPPEPLSAYNPDETNIMAYSPPDKCMSQFSLGQGERMRNSIATLPYLQSTIISDIACGEEDFCEENNYDPQVFLEYPWIEQEVAGYNCQQVVIEVHEFTHYAFISILFPALGNTPAEEKIYYMDGTFWCKDFPGLDCKAYYGLLNPAAVTCGCNQPCTGNACPTLCEQRDKNALLALYYATNGPNWNSTWNINQPISTWSGVTLDEDGCVKVLNLPNNGLNGTIATEIGTLENLTYLSLADNQISGNIPNSIGNLNSLGVLDLSNNNLSGAIPENLSTLPILTFLYLDNNNLSGNIPAIFANMENLNFLYLNNNQLSGNYVPQLEVLCAQLNNSNNASISSGNNFNQDWETFCFGGGGGELVWPGDLNNDSFVDAADQLFWGIASGSTGPPRPNATTNWVGQAAPDWETSFDGVNGKHQDADGNGVVDSDDLSVVALHLGRSNGDNNGVLLSIEPSEVNFNVQPINPQGDVQPVRLFVEDLQGDDVLAHGISGAIQFDNPAIANVTIDITGSSLDPNPAYVFQQYNAATNSFVFAITRTNGNNVLCNGYVATIRITISNSTTNDINMDFSKGKLVLSNGEMQTVANSGFSIPIFGVTLGYQLKATAYIVHPECNSLGKAFIDVYGGIQPYNFQWNTGVTTSTYNNLLPGAYEVTVTDNNGGSETLSIIINAQEPIYDANGELICGNACQAYLNPTGNVSSGAVQAKQLLESNATIQQNADVEFTAGERIRLSTGFSTKQNAKFKGSIEDCE